MDVKLLSITPKQSVAEQDAAYGKDLYKTDPDLCCALRKVQPLAETLAGTTPGRPGCAAPRRTTASSPRSSAGTPRRARSRSRRWLVGATSRSTAYIADNGVLVNPLVYDGYPSIGCAPCTRRVAPGEDPRSGRWAGTGKTECGIHT